MSSGTREWDSDEREIERQLAKDLHTIEILNARRKLYQWYGNFYDTNKKPGRNNIGTYDWQRRFHNLGSEVRQRGLFAANRIGKTTCAAAEVAIHMLGDYPVWWSGHRFDRPVNIWIGCESNEKIKETVQEQLIGNPSGTGWIPGARLIPTSNGNAYATRSGAIAGVMAECRVKHKSGGVSKLTTKTYDMRRDKWQGVKLDIIWFDEEPPEDIWSEGLLRLADTPDSILMMTFTPLLGATNVVNHFMEPEDKHASVAYMSIGWEDAPHLDEKSKREILASIPEHEREARSTGAPMLGSGAIFPISDHKILVDPFPIPWFWRRITGCDFGIGHPGAGAWLAINPDDDCIYLYDAYKRAGELPLYHASQLRKHGSWIPIAWPRDGLKTDPQSGIRLRDMYRDALGARTLLMIKEPAHTKVTDSKGTQTMNFSREPGLIDMYERMRTGRFKVFDNPGGRLFLKEKRMYHRKDGKVVDQNDDVISATRYAVQMKRYAKYEKTEERSFVPYQRPILGA